MPNVVAGLLLDGAAFHAFTNGHVLAALLKVFYTIALQSPSRLWLQVDRRCATESMKYAHSHLLYYQQCREARSWQARVAPSCISTAEMRASQPCRHDTRPPHPTTFLDRGTTTP